MTEKINTVVFNRGNIEWEKNNKNIEKQKVKEETQKKLSEFNILKEATKQFDIFKKKINDLKLPDKIKNKIIDEATSFFYSKDNDLNKLNWIKYLNGLIDTINENKDDLSSMKEKIQSYINDAMEKYPSTCIDSNTKIRPIILFLIALVAFIPVSEISVWATLFLITFGVLSVPIGYWYIFISSEESVAELTSKNNLFDTINDIYPQITEEEFNKIYDLYTDKGFNIKKFKQIMKGYENDGKITSEERKKIDEFISKASR